MATLLAGSGINAYGGGYQALFLCINLHFTDPWEMRFHECEG